MAESGHPFSGVFFAGLMITAKGPELIEYNVRFGDPECQVLMMRMKSDLLPLLYAAATGTLAGMKAEWRDETALTVVMASKGYPGSYEKNTPDRGAARRPRRDQGVSCRHSDEGRQPGRNGRAGAEHHGDRRKRQALPRTAPMRQLDGVSWDNGFYRHDIGWRAVAREKA